MDTLCDDALNLIFAKMEPESVIHLRRVCRRWRYLIQSSNSLKIKGLLFLSTMQPIAEWISHRAKDFSDYAWLEAQKVRFLNQYDFGPAIRTELQKLFQGIYIKKLDLKYDLQQWNQVILIIDSSEGRFEMDLVSSEGENHWDFSRVGPANPGCYHMPCLELLFDDMSISKDVSALPRMLGVPDIPKWVLAAALNALAADLLGFEKGHLAKYRKH
eukprot:gnl/Trimastix_PCT/4760.p1 GENE.gnl/Trimastix_PCT/4760~~gnl/Trimastix_PCT/4760.p1  ORF type:complete len:231 (+),score=22.69 gnl/Trimastix_PCT/4760:49-693(+)